MNQNLEMTLFGKDVIYWFKLIVQWLRTWVLRANRPGLKFQLSHRPVAKLGLFVG